MRENQARLSRNSPCNSLFLIISVIYQLRTYPPGFEVSAVWWLDKLSHSELFSLPLSSLFLSLSLSRMLYNLCRFARTNDAVTPTEIAWEFILPTLRRPSSNAKTFRGWRSRGAIETRLKNVKSCPSKSFSLCPRSPSFRSSPPPNFRPRDLRPKLFPLVSLDYGFSCIFKFLAWLETEETKLRISYIFATSGIFFFLCKMCKDLFCIYSLAMWVLDKWILSNWKELKF